MDKWLLVGIIAALLVAGAFLLSSRRAGFRRMMPEGMKKGRAKKRLAGMKVPKPVASPV
jgi:hypothetical protein